MNRRIFSALVLFLSIGIQVFAQGSLFRDALAAGREYRKFYHLRNPKPDTKFIELEELVKYCKSHDYAYDLKEFPVKFNVIAHYGRNDKTVTDFWFIPRQEYDAYLYDWFSINEDQPWSDLKPTTASAFFYDGGMVRIDNVRWSGTVSNGKIQGRGSGLGMVGKLRYAFTGNFKDGVAVNGEATFKVCDLNDPKWGNHFKQKSILAGSEADGMVSFMANDLWGFMGVNGEFVVPQYKAVKNGYQQGAALVTVKDEWDEHLIDKHGKDITDTSHPILQKRYKNDCQQLLSIHSDVIKQMGSSDASSIKSRKMIARDKRVDNFLLSYKRICRYDPDGYVALAEELDRFYNVDERIHKQLPYSYYRRLYVLYFDVDMDSYESECAAINGCMAATQLAYSQRWGFQSYMREAYVILSAMKDENTKIYDNSVEIQRAEVKKARQESAELERIRQELEEQERTEARKTSSSQGSSSSDSGGTEVDVENLNVSCKQVDTYSPMGSDFSKGLVMSIDNGASYIKVKFGHPGTTRDYWYGDDWGSSPDPYDTAVNAALATYALEKYGKIRKTGKQ
jgi:hypothetical protein